MGTADLPSRSPRESATIMTEHVLPQHTNVVGTTFGGTIMWWIDVCAAITAQRHARHVCVTARIEAVEFRAPIRLGDVVTLEGRLNAAFGTSMEVGVTVYREEAATCARVLCVDARATFVNVDADGRPAPVPALLLETDEDRELAAEATARRRARKAAKRADG